MKRRQFISISIKTGVVLMTTGYWGEAYTDSILQTYVNSLTGVAELGKAYKSSSVVQSGYLDLLDQKLSVYSSLASHQDIKLAVKKAIKEDFEDENICQIQGWQLSETECLLAASHVSSPEFVDQKNTEDENNKTFQNAKFEDFLEVQNWGPQSTIKGQIFNEQSDGHAGIWFVVENPDPGLTVYINGIPEVTYTKERSITSGIHDLEKLEQFLNDVGDSDIVIYDEINHRKQLIGKFSVLPIPEKYVYPDGQVSKVFCPVESWGPNKAKLGKAFNEQPNGKAAVWIKAKCVPRTVKVLLNGEAMKTTVNSKGVTASTSVENLHPVNNSYEITLYDDASGETLLVGKIGVSK